MRYFKLKIAYDGTDFHGWQIQANKPTIQGEIVAVLRRLTQENIQLLGAGRTDAGVHALGQVASFRTQSTLSAPEFQRALNALLPPAIRIVAAEETGPDFSARWSAKGKVYRDDSGWTLQQAQWIQSLRHGRQCSRMDARLLRSTRV